MHSRGKTGTSLASSVPLAIDPREDQCSTSQDPGSHTILIAEGACCWDTDLERSGEPAAERSSISSSGRTKVRGCLDPARRVHAQYRDHLRQRKPPAAADRERLHSEIDHGCEPHRSPLRVPESGATGGVRHRPRWGFWRQIGQILSDSTSPPSCLRARARSDFPGLFLGGPGITFLARFRLGTHRYINIGR